MAAGKDLGSAPGNRHLLGMPYLQVHTNPWLIYLILDGALECLAKLFCGCKFETEAGMVQSSTDAWRFSAARTHSTEVGR